MYRPEIEGFAKAFALGAERVDPLVLGVSKFPNVQLDKIDVPSTQFTDLTQRIQAIQDELGRPPVAAVFCSQGIYRSRVVASKLHESGLVKLSRFNWRREDVWLGREKGYVSSKEEMPLGAGIRAWESCYLGIADNGGLVHEIYPDEPIDLLVLALSSEGNREGLAKVASYFETRMPETAQERPAYLIWLNTTEDELDIWFPELALKK